MVTERASSRPSVEASSANEGKAAVSADAKTPENGSSAVDQAQAFSAESDAKEASPARSLTAQIAAQATSLWALGAASLLGAATATLVASRKRKTEIEGKQRNEFAGDMRAYEADLDVVDRNISESLREARALNEKVTNLNAKIRQSLDSGREALDQ